MTPDRQHALDLMTPGQSASAPLQERLDGVIHELLASFPNPAHLSAAEKLVRVPLLWWRINKM